MVSEKETKQKQKGRRYTCATHLQGTAEFARVCVTRLIGKGDESAPVSQLGPSVT